MEWPLAKKQGRAKNTSCTCQPCPLQAPQLSPLVTPLVFILIPPDFPRNREVVASPPLPQNLRTSLVRLASPCLPRSKVAGKDSLWNPPGPGRRRGGDGSLLGPLGLVLNQQRADWSQTYPLK